MYAALLRNEARLQGRTLASFLAIALAVYASGLILVVLRLPVLSGMGTVAAVGACLLLALGVPVVLLLRYYASMYGREGYLTHAVPTKHSTLYAAKFSWAVGVWLGALVIALTLGLGLFVGQTIAAGGTVTDAWTTLGQALASFGTAPTIVMAVWLLIGLVIYVAQFGWIVTFGMEERFRSFGLGGPILVWFLTYVIMQILVLASIIAIPLGVTPDLSQFVFQSFLAELPAALEGTDPSFIPLGWLPILLATLPVYVVWTLRSLRDHTSLR